MSTRCELYTKRGKRCKNRATQLCKELKLENCTSHSKICKKLISEKKRVCAKVWNIKCLDSMNESQLISIIQFAERCRIHRVQFQKICYREKTDNSHRGAIVKMDKLVDKCYDIYKKKFIKN
jgi:hypothetical protein